MNLRLIFALIEAMKLEIEENTINKQKTIHLCEITLYKR